MSPILSALALVAAIGFAASILLSLVSHFFAVEKDETEAKIRDMLPGVNCGACGYKGCNDYAKQLALGNAAPNLCIPGGADLAASLADFCGTAAADVDVKVAVVHCNGTCETTKTQFTYEGIASCRAAAAVYGGASACKFGCLGYGDCADVCPADAVCILDGIARIDTVRCIGCGKCAEACPKSIISVIPESATTAVLCSSRDKGADARRVCSSSCIGCKKCEKICEAGAIKVDGNLAAIDYSLCNGCGKCAEACPTHAIVSK